MNPICFHFRQRDWTVRLACLKRAASVHPEPGSNSHIKIWWACSSNLLFIKTLLLFSYFRTIELCLLCLIIKVLIVAFPSDVSYNTSFSLICQHFFQSFFKTFLLPNLASLDALENFLILLQTNQFVNIFFKVFWNFLVFLDDFRRQCLHLTT